MEGILFIIILVVFNLLRSGARQQQRKQPPPPPALPRRPVLMEPEARGAREEQAPLSRPRPALQRVFIDENIYRFPRKETLKLPAEQPSPIEVEDLSVTESGEVPSRPGFDTDRERKALFFKDRKDLARGIILAEVLGPPLSKRKKRGFV